MDKNPPASVGDSFDPWSGKILHAAEQLSPGAWSLSFTTRVATAMRNPCTTTESSPRSPQLEKSLSSSEDPAQPKISKQ